MAKKQATHRAATSEKALRRAWKKLREVLPTLLVRDAIDWLDFTRELDSEIAELRRDIKQGRYRPSAVLEVRLSKSKGFSRAIRTLAPRDMLLYRALVDELYDAMRFGEHPSVYFSRGRKQPKKNVTDDTVSFDDTDYEAWFETWARLQQARKTTGLDAKTKYMLVTDLAAYFDSIHHDPLKHVLAPYVRDEEFMSLLLFLLEHFGNRRGFEPQVFVGIPQDEIECSRVLGHLFLFFLDQALAADPEVHQFSRWMDDITIAVGSKTDARRVASRLQLIAEAKHLRFNTGKTLLLEQTEIASHYFFAENTICDDINENLHDPLFGYDARKKLTGLIATHLKAKRLGQWEKILRRLITLECKLGATRLMALMPSMLEDRPSLADKAGELLRRFPRRTPTIEKLATYLTSRDCVDHSVQIFLLRALTDASLTPKGQRIARTAAQYFLTSKTHPSVLNEALFLIARLGDGRSWKSFDRLAGHASELHASTSRTLLAICLSLDDPRLTRATKTMLSVSSPDTRRLEAFLRRCKTVGAVPVVGLLGMPNKRLGGTLCLDMRRLLLLRFLTHSSDAGTAAAAGAKGKQWLVMCPKDSAAARLLAPRSRHPGGPTPQSLL